MGATSAIEWTEATWSPLVGCTKVSPGCENCYAETQVNTRFHPAALAKGGKHLEAFPTPFETVSIRPDRFLTLPLHWRKPRRIFVNSLSDLFHKDVPYEFVVKVFAVMVAAERHTFQLLTKRPGRMRSVLRSNDFWRSVYLAAVDLGVDDPQDVSTVAPPRNVWAGVSVESADWLHRVDTLRETPAAIRWISAEPLLGPLNGLDLTGIDWLVCGGESGAGARPMHPDWARSIRDYCVTAGVPYLFKQWGNWAPFPVYQGAEKNTFVMNAATGEGTYYSQRNQPGNAEMWHVGKKAAGRELDGRTWDGYPVVGS